MNERRTTVDQGTEWIDKVASLGLKTGRQSESCRRFRDGKHDLPQGSESFCGLWSFTHVECLVKVVILVLTRGRRAMKLKQIEER